MGETKERIAVLRHRHHTGAAQKVNMKSCLILSVVVVVMMMPSALEGAWVDPVGKCCELRKVEADVHVFSDSGHCIHKLFCSPTFPAPAAAVAKLTSETFKCGEVAFAKLEVCGGTIEIPNAFLAVKL